MCVCVCILPTHQPTCRPIYLVSLPTHQSTHPSAYPSIYVSATSPARHRPIHYPPIPILPVPFAHMLCKSLNMSTIIPLNLCNYLSIHRSPAHRFTLPPCQDLCALPSKYPCIWLALNLHIASPTPLPSPLTSQSITSPSTPLALAACLSIIGPITVSLIHLLQLCYTSAVMRLPTPNFLPAGVD